MNQNPINATITIEEESMLKEHTYTHTHTTMHIVRSAAPILTIYGYSKLFLFERSNCTQLTTSIGDGHIGQRRHEPALANSFYSLLTFNPVNIGCY
jgi:hypothetical protein